MIFQNHGGQISGGKTVCQKAEEHARINSSLQSSEENNTDNLILNI
jgi:hypothetical protein